MRRSGAPSQGGYRPPAFKVPRPEGAPVLTPRAGPTTNVPSSNPPTPDLKSNEGERHFSAIWCKCSARKHKKWEDDALLIVRAAQRLAILKDTSGKELARGSGLSIPELANLNTGNSITFGGREIEILEEMTGTACDKGIQRDEIVPRDESDAALPFHRPKVISSTVFKPFTVPTRFGTTFQPMGNKENSRISIFNKDSQDALVMPRPPFDFKRQCDEIVDVVVDPHLSKHLRPHQRQGVSFLYRCIMGFQDPTCHGAILADEMGLGKTLQTISLIWTLMKQGPFAGKPVIKRTLILAPSSLVKNWEGEFQKWLGRERIETFAVDGSNRVHEAFKRARLPVLIMSYEMFNKSFEDIQRFLQFDLIVCDEGHRLKNDKIKASTFLAQVDCDRRIVLTGTPIQNDLKEFYAIMCVVNPNVVGTSKTFTSKFEDPIVKSKQPEATEEQRQIGQSALEVLTDLTNRFILRRTQDIISKYLPSKTEFVLFCRPSAIQIRMYQNALHSLGSSYLVDSSCVLGSIQKLRKICNHPSMCDIAPELEEDMANLTFEEQGSKLALVSHLLYNLRTLGSEKIVIVSISTQVLDLMGELCTHYDYPFLRLDGSTSTNQRQVVVNRFNDRLGKDFVLLLSSKAGGTGLNLIGASRILLYDMDWNPAHDIQAMARVWRDGQKRPVLVYRLATSGTIEEKIFQRQITKQGLGGGLMDGKSTQFHFSQTDLKDLFSFQPNVDCETHELLDCDCDGSGNNVGSEPRVKSEVELRDCQIGEAIDPTTIDDKGIKGLLQWQHLLPPIGLLGDQALADIPVISYALKNEFNQTIASA
ncbi:hypothetical protein TCAL_13441 [Tigriopus californicus]|uniref:DNA repair and recombination protein RAD54-like n=1 Tax=Tigriopus californicus TaxID=6832 RepID=A0A553NVF3_TIGCA|nr:DNA repair and recombination protein RAD54B-like [Tigriopus californicus]TRY69409.1 hypothetical protein TCAL_13441 [Tigriopus californicus]|eukprot:TCALIF_13441-PA protein Name:"Similar to Rad54b DNA repair and recombination protein RAD54B (Mus musculus)" AED:0.04 eAED:0.04 QI:152/1/0.75/1/1/1/4/0/816